MTCIADSLDGQALALREIAAGVMQSGLPVDVHMANGARKTLDALTALDILDEATALENDAAKLRLIYARGA